MPYAEVVSSVDTLSRYTLMVVADLVEGLLGLHLLLHT